jgi:Rps23 Pro-64 3,4-dihydroxylase Tpa1-like proline 4-hydroxylase
MPDPAPQEMQAPPARSIMPPYRVLHDFFDAATVDGLLAHSLALEETFTPTRIGSKGIDPAVRRSRGTRDLGPFRPIFEKRMAELAPTLVAELGLTPFEVHSIELQLVAHGEGAFYLRHIDTQTARIDEVERLRVLSGVYYFHALPKAFSGGELRLFAIGPSATQFVDVTPEHNSLLIFPSWAPHEVRPVICPSGRFADSRFAINCWVHKRKVVA